MIRKVVLGGLLLSSVNLLGCSLSICGQPVLGKDELVFSCEDFSSFYTKTTEESAQEKTADEQDVSNEQATEESVNDQNSNENEASKDGKVDLNSAGVEDLMTLKGIGETRAKEIIEYRTKNGAFKKKEDIMQVPGIKEGVYSKVQDQIVVY